MNFTSVVFLDSNKKCLFFELELGDISPKYMKRKPIFSCLILSHLVVVFADPIFKSDEDREKIFGQSRKDFFNEMMQKLEDSFPPETEDNSKYYDYMIFG